jgi:hypothetical protein
MPEIPTPLPICLITSLVVTAVAFTLLGAAMAFTYLTRGR